MTDNVNHPSHYASSKIEVIEAIEAWELGFHLGNVVKYTARAGKKNPDKFVEDLEKAQWYLKRKIELLKAMKEQREVTRPNDMNPTPSPLTVREDVISVTDVCTLEIQGPQTDGVKDVQNKQCGCNELEWCDFHFRNQSKRQMNFAGDEKINCINCNRYPSYDDSLICALCTIEKLSESNHT